MAQLDDNGLDANGDALDENGEAIIKPVDACCEAMADCLDVLYREHMDDRLKVGRARRRCRRERAASHPPRQWLTARGAGPRMPASRCGR